MMQEDAWQRYQAGEITLEQYVEICIAEGWW